jgi:hypothetical protein
MLLLYTQYCNNARTHLSLNKDAPVPRLFRQQGAFFQHQFSADYTISMFGFDFRQGQDGTMERFEEQFEVIRTANHERQPCRSCPP